MKQIVTLLCTVTFLFSSFIAQAQITPGNKNHKIRFSYDKIDLTAVINDIAAEAEINIILPQGKNAVKGKLTFHYPKKITVGQAWEFLVTILETAGYSVVPKGSFHTIVPNSTDPNKRPLPLFMGVKPSDLPDTDERIRYVYFFSNINLTNSTQKKEITTILEDMLPKIDTKNLNQQLDASINAAILNSTASRIKSAMKIISTLDETGFTETAIVITLKHTQADFVQKLFKGDPKNPRATSLIGAPTGRFPFFGEQKKKKRPERYFSETTRVTALPRTNQIAILGKKDAVKKVLEFIEKYIDIPLDPKGSAKSLIHVYDLNYLDAQKFKKVLDSVIHAPPGTPARGRSTIGGVDFSKVIIAAEQEVAAKTVQGGIQAVQQQKQQQDGAKEGKSYVGGNRLIIAAREREWKMIKGLIEELDSEPQPQVALDVLIVDLSLDDVRSLGSQLRNKQLSPFFKTVNFQSAHLANPWLNFDDSTPAQIINPPGIAADLLRPELPNNIDTSLSGNTKVNIAASTTPGVASPFTEAGSFFLSAGEKNCEFDKIDNPNPIWFLLQALQASSDAHIISRPFVVTANNSKADILLAQERLVQGDASVENNGPAIVNKKNLTAALQVSVTPRVSAGKNVNLTLTINSNQFINSADLKNDTIQTRTITTNANVQDGHVLVLGGLSQDREDEVVRETPILGKIPILGYFFKKKRKKIEKRSLLVFIVPSIIRPLSTYAYRSLISPYTHDKLDLARETVENDRYFGDTRDPLSRAFFGTDESDASIQQIDDFVDREVFKMAKVEKPSGKPEAKEAPKPKTPAPPAGGMTPATPIPLAEQKILKAEGKIPPLPAKNNPVVSRASRMRGMLSNVENPLKK